MRLPGTRRIETRLVTALEITPKDRRVISRGRKDLTSSVVGAGTGYVQSGGDLFADWKAGATMIATSALTAMVLKHQSEKVTAARFTPPPKEAPK